MFADKKRKKKIWGSGVAKTNQERSKRSLAPKAKKTRWEKLDSKDKNYQIMPQPH